MRGREGVVDDRGRRAWPARRRRPGRSSPRPCGSGCSRAAARRRPSSPRPRPRPPRRCSPRRRRPAAEHRGQRRHHRLQRELRLRPALRAAEMGEQDDLAALLGDLADGRGAARMRVSSVTLPSAIGTLRSTRTSTRLPFTSASSRCGNARSCVCCLALDRACPWRRRCRPCGWRSPTRCRTRRRHGTNVPSITLVWSRAKVDDAGSWLKSDETQRLVGDAEDALSRPTWRRRR